MLSIKDVVFRATETTTHMILPRSVISVSSKSMFISWPDLGGLYFSLFMLLMLESLLENSKLLAPLATDRVSLTFTSRLRLF